MIVRRDDTCVLLPYNQQVCYEGWLEATGIVLVDERKMSVKVEVRPGRQMKVKRVGKHVWLQPRHMVGVWFTYNAWKRVTGMALEDGKWKGDYMYYVVMQGNKAVVTERLIEGELTKRLGEWVGNERWVRKRMAAPGGWFRPARVGDRLMAPDGLAKELLRIGRAIRGANTVGEAEAAYAEAGQYLAHIPGEIVAKFNEAYAKRLEVLT